MRDYSTYYGWFLLIVTALPAVMRIALPRQVAAIASERMADEKKRRRYRWYGIVSIVSGVAMVPAYFFYPRLWLLVAFGIGVLTGAEMIGNAVVADAPRIERQNRIFGVLYGAACVAVYFLLIRG